MEYTLDEVKEEFEKQVAELEKIENEIQKLYEDKLVINEIKILEETSGPINKQMSLINEQLAELNSYGLTDLNKDKQNLLDKLDKLRKYKDFIKQKSDSNSTNSETIEEIERKNAEKIEAKQSEKEIKIDLINNLNNICDEELENLDIEKGKGGNIEAQLMQYSELTKTINHFDRYGKFLTKENKKILEQAKERQKKIEEEIVQKLPDLEKMMEISLSKEDALKDKYEDVKKEILESEAKQNRIKTIKDSIKKELQRINEATYGKIEEQLEEQNKKIEELESRKQTKEAAVEEEKNINEIIDQLRASTNNEKKDIKEETNFTPIKDVTSETDKIRNERINVNDLIGKKQDDNKDEQNNDKKTKEEYTFTMSEILDNLNIDKDTDKIITKEQIEQMDKIIENMNENENKDNNVSESKENNLTDNKDNNTPEADENKLTENQDNQIEEQKLPKKLPKINKQYVSEPIQQSQQQQVLTEEDYNMLDYYYGKPEKISKKVKRKVSKEKFEHRVKKALKQIKNFFIQEIPEKKLDILENVKDLNEQVPSENLSDYLFTEKYGEAIDTDLNEKGRNK